MTSQSLRDLNTDFFLSLSEAARRDSTRIILSHGLGMSAAQGGKNGEESATELSASMNPRRGDRHWVKAYPPFPVFAQETEI
jgi:hypothetical protein